MQAAAVADLQVRTGKVLAGEIISSEIRKGGEGGEGGGGGGRMLYKGCRSRLAGALLGTFLFGTYSVLLRKFSFFFHPRNYSTGSEDPSVIDVIRVG